MNGSARANVASSFTILKGALIEESYSFLSCWNPGQTREDNIRIWKERNPIGARSHTWLRDVAFVMNRRFDPLGKDLPLRILAERGFPLDEWKPLLLWHITRDEFVLRDFLIDWLYPAFADGTYRMRAEDLYAHLKSLGARGGQIGRVWADTTVDRVAHSLLVMTRDFGLTTGGTAREFAPYHLPERSFLYLLHAMREERGSPSKVVASTDWRMFLMRPDDVERELLRLHQFRKLEYDVAGSLVQLALPCASSREYAERMVA